MSAYTLLMLEAIGIQEYIFGSNDLGQNIGASENVARATGEWIFETLDELALTHNVSKNGNHYEVNAETGQYSITDQSVLAQQVQAEIVYAGVGNALVLFADATMATRLSERLTRRILLDAPGLQVVTAQHTARETDVLSAVVADLRRALAKRKADPVPVTPLGGLGVTAACAYTGLPAVGRDDEGQLISAVVRGKLNGRAPGEKRLERILPRVKQAGLEFVYDFDQFGKKGESSYIAVIHTDGNGMGKRIENISQAYNRPEQNAQFIRALREWSRTVSTATTRALQTTVDALLFAADSKEVGKSVFTPDESRLRFRPIVFGGDDVTFVCEGRLGLSSAAKYLAELHKQILADKNPFYARAGVAVVKTHFPFSRAYDLATALGASAKRYIAKRQEPPHNEPDATALDWHFAVSGLVLDLNQIRAREYTVPAGSLLMRPLRINDPDRDPAHAWTTFTRLVKTFQEDKDWAGRRNQIKSLREALRAGSAATEQFLRAHELKPLPEIDPSRPDFQKQGWHGGECGYFDAIEAMDFFVALEEG